MLLTYVEVECILYSKHNVHHFNSIRYLIGSRYKRSSIWHVCPEILRCSLNTPIFTNTHRSLTRIVVQIRAPWKLGVVPNNVQGVFPNELDKSAPKIPTSGIPNVFNYNPPKRATLEFFYNYLCALCSQFSSNLANIGISYAGHGPTPSWSQTGSEVEVLNFPFPSV